MTISERFCAQKNPRSSLFFSDFTSCAVACITIKNKPRKKRTKKAPEIYTRSKCLYIDQKTKVKIYQLIAKKSVEKKENRAINFLCLLKNGRWKIFFYLEDRKRGFITLEKRKCQIENALHNSFSPLSALKIFGSRIITKSMNQFFRASVLFFLTFRKLLAAKSARKRITFFSRVKFQPEMRGQEKPFLLFCAAAREFINEGLAALRVAIKNCFSFN